MAEVNGKKITMTRGDTAEFDIQIVKKVDKKLYKYEPEEGDTLRFAVKRSYTDKTPVILKNIPIDTMVLTIDPEDTKKLGFGNANGRYVYDIELVFANGNVETVIPRGELLILEEVY